MDPPRARQRLERRGRLIFRRSRCRRPVQGGRRADGRQATLFLPLDALSAMKNSSSPLRGAPMPGGRSFTQFRAARIRRVSFQWRQAAAEPSPGGKGDGSRRT